MKEEKKGYYCNLGKNGSDFDYGGAREGSRKWTNLRKMQVVEFTEVGVRLSEYVVTSEETVMRDSQFLTHFSLGDDAAIYGHVKITNAIMWKNNEYIHYSLGER